MIFFHHVSSNHCMHIDTKPPTARAATRVYHHQVFCFPCEPTSDRFLVCTCRSQPLSTGSRRLNDSRHDLFLHHRGPGGRIALHRSGQTVFATLEESTLLARCVPLADGAQSSRTAHTDGLGVTFVFAVPVVARLEQVAVAPA